MKHYFVDTNIVIDMLADRIPFADAACAVFDLAEHGDIKLSICALSYSNIYYIVRREIGHDATIEALKELTNIVNILAVDDDIIKQSLHSNFGDFEDAIQYFSAMADSSIEGIITRNPKDFKHSVIPLVSPDNLVRDRAI